MDFIWDSESIVYLASGGLLLPDPSSQVQTDRPDSSLDSVDKTGVTQLITSDPSNPKSSNPNQHFLKSSYDSFVKANLYCLRLGFPLFRLF